MLQTSNRRNFLLPVTVLAIAAAAFFGFKYYQAINTGILPVATDTTKCGPCMAYNNVGTASSQMDMNLAKTLAYNRQHRPGATADETRSVWFDLATLKNFIYQIESKTCACDSILGVRVYFGKYPSDNAWTNTFSPELGGLRNKVLAKYTNLPAGQINAYENIQTLFMVPTHQINSINYDFDPKDPTTLCTADRISGGYDSKYQKVNNPAVFTTTRFGVSITALMAQNHGDACPPIPSHLQKCPDEGAYFDY